MITSGLVEGFETYNFDVFTIELEISGVFQGVMESISIAEVIRTPPIPLPRMTSLGGAGCLVAAMVPNQSQAK